MVGVTSGGRDPLGTHNRKGIPGSGGSTVQREEGRGHKADGWRKAPGEPASKVPELEEQVPSPGTKTKRGSKATREVAHYVQTTRAQR